MMTSLEITGEAQFAQIALRALSGMCAQIRSSYRPIEDGCLAHHHRLEQGYD
jgi:hypothetical protein